ncbi:hypothetical protein [Paenibacillus sp. Marseille-Q9583]
MLNSQENLSQNPISNSNFSPPILPHQNRFYTGPLPQKTNISNIYPFDSKRMIPANSDAYGHYFSTFKPSLAIDHDLTSGSFWFYDDVSAELQIYFPDPEYITAIEFTATCGINTRIEYTIFGARTGQPLTQIGNTAPTRVSGNWANTDIGPIQLNPSGFYDQINIACDSDGGYIGIREVYLR